MHNSRPDVLSCQQIVLNDRSNCQGDEGSTGIWRNLARPLPQKKRTDCSLSCAPGDLEEITFLSIMKSMIHVFAVLLFITTGIAEPLHKEQVGADVKWLVHLDVDSFLASKVGQFVMQEFVEKKLARQTSELNK